MPKKYALELIAQVGMSLEKPCKNPMEVNLKLISIEYDKLFQVSREDALQSDPTTYKRLIGKLLYLTIIRLNISYVVQHLSQYMQCPKTLHYEATLRVVKYVKQHPGPTVMHSAYYNKNLFVYCDSNWVGCIKS